MTYPRVTIVTPTLNQAGFIRETIDSVLSQDYPNIEYIVIDGGSTDGTQEILKSYGNRLVWVERSGNQASAINYGMRIASGLILHWLNSDDTLLPGAVSEAARMFVANPHAAVVYGDTLFTGPTGIPLYSSVSNGIEITDLFVRGNNPIPQPSAFIHEEAWLGLDESLEYFMDWDLWLRVGQPIVHVSRIWSTYRLHSSSKTCNRYPVEELKKIYGKQFRGVSLPAFVYNRMADYHAANGEWLKAKFRRAQAWIKG